MADVERTVTTKFAVDSKRAVGSLGGLSSGFGRIGSLITQVTSRINPLNMALGGLAGAMSIKAITDMGDKFEQTQITMAGFLSSLGISSNYAQGFEQASSVMDKIRVDAAALPGEANEYIEVFKAGLPAVQKAVGGTIDQMTAFTNRYTAIAKTLQVDSAQAARDLMLMLREGKGGAGMDVRTFMQLLPFMKKVEDQADLTREKFNKMTAPERAQLMSKTFEKMGPMLDKSANSFDAMAGALKSNSKEILRLATVPLFEAAKKGLERINKLIYDDKGQLTAMGQSIVNVGRSISQFIVRGMEVAVQMAVSLYEKFQAFTKSPFFQAISEAVQRLVDALSKAGGVLGGLTGGLFGGGEGEEGGAGAAVAGGAAGGIGALLGPTATILIGAFTSLASNTEAMGSIFTSLSGIVGTTMELLAPLMELFGQISGVLGDLLAAVLPPVLEAFNQLWEALGPIVAEFLELASQLMSELRPVLKELFTALGGLIKEVVVALIPVITALAKATLWVYETFVSNLMPAIKMVVGWISQLANAFASLIQWIAKTVGEAIGTTAARKSLTQMETAGRQAVLGMGGKGTRHPDFGGGGGGGGGGARGGGGRATNDFRFSKFEITQKFAEGFDPDRIAVAFAQDVGRIGETALQSGFEPLFSVK